MEGHNAQSRETAAGRWGADDERGAANLLSPDVVRAAMQSATSGRIYPLGLPIHRGVRPQSPHRASAQRLTMANHSDTMYEEHFGATPGSGANEDVIILASHDGTHMDALCHVFHDDKIYNGFGKDTFTPYGGAGRCGIEKAGPIVTRGVLLDVAGHLGKDWLDATHIISAAELEACRASQDVEIRAGDVVLIRTGWLDWFDVHQETLLEWPGIGPEAAVYLGDQDVVAVGCDNLAVEAYPMPTGEYLPVHVELLVKRGVYLIENVNLKQLAADRCYEFLFVAAPLAVAGASASPVSPVAIG